MIDPKFEFEIENIGEEAFFAVAPRSTSRYAAVRNYLLDLIDTGKAKDKQSNSAKVICANNAQAFTLVRHIREHVQEKRVGWKCLTTVRGNIAYINLHQDAE